MVENNEVKIENVVETFEKVLEIAKQRKKNKDLKNNLESQSLEILKIKSEEKEIEINNKVEENKFKNIEIKDSNSNDDVLVVDDD